MNAQKAEISIRNLPNEDTRALAGVIGLENTIKVIEHFPKQYLYISGTFDFRENVVRDRQDGMSVRDLCDKYKLCAHTIRKYIRQARQNHSLKEPSQKKLAKPQHLYPLFDSSD